jgi:hypothetical protein
VEAYRILRSRCSYIFYPVRLQIAVRFTALRISRALPRLRFLVLNSVRDWEMAIIVNKYLLCQVTSRVWAGIQQKPNVLIVWAIFLVFQAVNKSFADLWTYSAWACFRDSLYSWKSSCGTPSASLNFSANRNRMPLLSHWKPCCHFTIRTGCSVSPVAVRLRHPLGNKAVSRVCNALYVTANGFRNIHRKQSKRQSNVLLMFEVLNPLFGETYCDITCNIWGLVTASVVQW